LRRNEFVDWQKDRGHGVDPDDFPFGMSYAPVELEKNLDEIPEDLRIREFPR